MSDDILYTSRIDSCNFYIIGSEDIQNDNDIIITEKQSDSSIYGGVKDPKMGATSNIKCGTCNNSKGVCPGHFGKLKLKYPVKNMIFHKEILKILKRICLHCKNLLKDDEYANSNKLLKVKKKRAKNSCKNCGKTIYKIRVNKGYKMIYEKVHPTGKIEKLYNHQVLEILQGITHRTAKKMGYAENSHPSKLILDHILIPPNPVRPEIPKSTLMEKVNDDLTILIQHLIKYNKIIDEIIPDEIIPGLEEKYINMDLIYQSMITGTSDTKNSKLKILSNTNKPMNNIVSRITGKKGRIRQNIMGKRVENMMRSVITGDSYINIDEVGVPKSIAIALFIPETFRSYNKQRLMIYFNNGSKVYPGCKSIKKKIDNRVYSIDKLHELNYKPQEGDIIYRHLIDRDSIGFNRQPSLLISNIGTHFIKVIDNINTLSMNVSSCNFYNADFDGDTMNGILSTGIQAINEARELSYNGNWFIDFRNQTPMIGLFQDSLTGVAELTRSKVKINKWHAMYLLGQSDNRLLSEISIDENKTYSGRDLISLFIPSDINIKKKKPSIYLEQYANVMNEFDKNDIVVNIKNGQLQTGILDSATVKQNKENSLFHMMYNHKGIKYTINSLYQMQHLIHKYLFINGFTIGMKDMLVNENIIKEIKRKNATIINQANKVTEKLNKGELIPPINMTLKQFYELQQMQSLNVSDDIVQPILSDMNFNDNGLAKLVLSGSKGKLNHIISINGIIGTQQIKGKRAKMNFGVNRTSPYFFRHDTSPQSRGYIENSYIEGMNPSTFMFACYEGRQAMVNNAMSTRIAGYQNRICVKNLESIIINNLFHASKYNKIIQLLYAESGFDFRSLMHVRFPSIMMSKKDFEENYKTDINKFDKEFRNNKNKELLNKEFEQLKIDRMFYRKIFMKIEKTSMDSYLFSDIILLPVKFNDLLENISNTHEDLRNRDKLDPNYVINKLIKFCDELVYIYTNNIQKKNKAKLPSHLHVAINLLKQVMRAYLCTNNLVKYKINNSMFDILLDKILIKLYKSLIDYGTPVGIIAAQASSEPLTQDVLNSKHKSGIGDTTKTRTLDRIQEILGGKDTKKLKNPSMLIRVLPEYEDDEVKMQELSNIIKEVKLKNFIDNIQIFFEKFGEPVHPDYVNEKGYIEKYLKYNIVSIDKSNYISWCIRFGINRNKLIFKNITLEEIIISLEKQYKNISFIYSPQNSDIVFIRCYIKYDYFNKERVKFNVDVLHCIKNLLLNTIIRGINNILSTKVSDMMISEINEDKSIFKKKIYVISTIGSNLEAILDLNFVDKEKTQTDSILEMEELYGIDCARNKIINEIIYSMSAASRIHSSIFADEMTYTGEVTPIGRNGLNKREGDNIWLNISFEGPIQSFRNACIRGNETKIADISSPIVMGEAPIVGTRYNKIINNEQFIKKYHENLSSNIDELI